MNICVQMCVSGRSSSFLGCVLGCGIAGFHSNCVSLFEQLSDCFPSSCAVLHSHWWCLRVPVSQHSCQSSSL